MKTKREVIADVLYKCLFNFRSSERGLSENDIADKILEAIVEDKRVNCYECLGQLFCSEVFSTTKECVRFLEKLPTPAPKEIEPLWIDEQSHYPVNNQERRKINELVEVVNQLKRGE
jgi:hypothetical protein